MPSGKMEKDKSIIPDTKRPSKAEVTFSQPIDRGWSWVIMIGVFGIHFMSIGYQRSFGILFVEFQERYGSSSALTSAIVGSQSFSYCFLTLFVMNYVVQRIPVRTTCIIGCLLSSLGIAVSCLVPSALYLIVTQGVLFGCGHACIYCPSLLILSQYFEKRRPIATTLATCGASVGGIVFPIVTTTFVEWYGLQGALLLLSGLILQELLFIMMFTPPEDYKSREESACDHINDDYSRDETQTGVEPECSPDVNINGEEKRQTSHDIESDYQNNDVWNKTAAAGEVKQPLMFKHEPHNLALLSRSHGHIAAYSQSPGLQERLQNRTISKSHHELPTVIYHPYSYRHHQRAQPTTDFLQTMSSSSIEQVNASMPSLLLNDLPTLMKRYQPGRNTDVNDHRSQHSIYQNISVRSTVEAEVESQVCPKSSRSFCRVPSIMKLPTFWVLAVFFTCGAIGTGNPIVFIPPLAKERGLTEENAAFFLMVSSMVEMFGRIMPGLILHANIMRPSTLMIFPPLICGLTYHLTPLFTDFNSVLVLTLVYGLLSSSFWALQTLVVIEVLGLDNLASSIGFYAIFMGSASGASFPIGGSLRDATGTYSSSFHYFGTAYVIAAASLCFLQLMTKNEVNNRDIDKNQEKDGHKDNTGNK